VKLHSQPRRHARNIRLSDRSFDFRERLPQRPTLSDVREPMLTIVCEPCGRRGRGHLPQGSTGSGEDDPHRVESVVRADVVLGLEGGEMLRVGRKVWALKSEEHEHATRRLELGLKEREPITDTAGVAGEHSKSLSCGPQEAAE
jgi:hypothetical protein